MTSGIYKITCATNGKFYIGSAVNIKRRFNKHIFDLRSGVHHNSHLQYAWDKYGDAAFTFSIIEECEEAVLIEREQYWIDTLNASDRSIGFNKREVASSNIGIKLSTNTRMKISKAKKGRPVPEDIKLRISASLKGKLHPHSGHQVSEETRKKMSVAQKKRPPESYSSVREKMTGRYVSDETRLKLRLFRLGKSTGKGRKQSPEHIAKRVASRLANKMNRENS